MQDLTPPRLAVSPFWKLLCVALAAQSSCSPESPGGSAPADGIVGGSGGASAAPAVQAGSGGAVAASGSGGTAGSGGGVSGAGSGGQSDAPNSGTCFAGNAGPELMLGEWISNDPALTDPYDAQSLLELYLPPGVNVIRGLVFMHGRGTPERPSHTRGMAEVAQVWSFGMIRGYIWEIAGERLSHQAQARFARPDHR